MSGEMILLEQWVQGAAGAVRGQKRQFYIFFQKDWTQSHMNNPLLYPMEQTPDQWKAHFDWFVTFETFKPAGQEKAQSPKESLPELKSPVTQPKQAPPVTAEDAASETVVMDALEDIENLKTKIYEASVQDADQGTVVMQAKEAPVEGTVVMQAEPELVSEDTAEDDLGDLDDLVEAHQAEKPPQPPSAGKAEPIEPRTEEEAYTIVMDAPEGEDDHGETVVMDANNEPEAPAPKPVASQPPPKEAKPASKPKTEKEKATTGDGDLELELDDLDDMDWV